MSVIGARRFAGLPEVFSTALIMLGSGRTGHGHNDRWMMLDIRRWIHRGRRFLE
jgi:hypothetical protein